MHTVEALYVGGEFVTSVWISRHANRTLRKFARKHRKAIPNLLDKVMYWATEGFKEFEGGKGCPIKPERDGVFRLGHTTLFRLLGFYENDEGKPFVIIDAILKSGTSLGSHEQGRIREVARVKAEGSWRKGKADER